MWEPHDDIPGRFAVADAAGSIVVSAPVLDWAGWCMEFWGTRTSTSFEAWIPVDCDGCCCDFWIEGTFGPSSVSGTYHHFDGICHAEAFFEGTRIP